MDFEVSAKQRQVPGRAVGFMQGHIEPAIPRCNQKMNVFGDARRRSLTSSKS